METQSSKLIKSPDSSAAVKNKRPYNGGLPALYQKEMSDHINSPRFLIAFILLLLVSAASIYGAVSGISSAASSATTTDTTTNDYLFLKLFTTSGSSIPAFASFMAFLGPLVGIVLGFDAVSRERSQGTLNRLVSQPIYRDSVINGKFLAGFSTIFILVFSLGLFVCGFGILYIGIAPTWEEVIRIIAFLLLTVVYTSFWLGLSILFSVTTRHAATSALCCIAIWIFVSFFLSMIAGSIADAVYPLTGYGAVENQLKNYSLSISLERVSPYYLFCEAIATILNPNVRSLSVTNVTAYSGAVASYLSVDQSLLLIWPHLVGMIALTVLCFVISYILFMRQEIRAN
jgi:ABC-2 type transport system permease protein